MFAKVTDNNIQIIPTLPTSYTFEDGSKTGGFNLLDADIIRGEGYYPVVDVKPDFNALTETLVVSDISVDGDNVVRTYQAQPIDLQVLKERKYRDIIQEEEALLANSFFLFNGNVFRLSLQSVNDATQLQAAIAVSSFPSNFSWTDVYGNEVPMNEAEFTAFGATLAGQKLNIVGVSKYHRAVVKSLTNAMDVVNYDYSQGWNNYTLPDN